MFEQHGIFAARVLRSFGVRDADLDDMLQEVFLVVARRGGDYEELGRARSWMYSICRRVAVAGRRRQLHERAAIVTHHDEPACAPTQLEHVEGREALELCERLLNQLPPVQRLIFDAGRRRPARVIGSDCLRGVCPRSRTRLLGNR